MENVITSQYIYRSVIVLSISSFFLFKKKINILPNFFGSGPLEKKVCELYSHYCESS